MYTNQKPFFCEICGYKSNHKSNFEKHLETQKHVLRKTSKKVWKYFYCEICDYSTSRKHNYDLHILTAKHKKNEKLAKKVSKTSKKKSDNINKKICDKPKQHDNGVEDKNSHDDKKSMKKTSKKVWNCSINFCQCIC